MPSPSTSSHKQMRRLCWWLSCQASGSLAADGLWFYIAGLCCVPGTPGSWYPQWFYHHYRSYSVLPPLLIAATLPPTLADTISSFGKTIQGLTSQVHALPPGTTRDSLYCLCSQQTAWKSCNQHNFCHSPALQLVFPVTPSSQCAPGPPAAYIGCTLGGNTLMVLLSGFHCPNSGERERERDPTFNNYCTLTAQACASVFWSIGNGIACIRQIAENGILGRMIRTRFWFRLTAFSFNYCTAGKLVWRHINIRYR